MLTSPVVVASSITFVAGVSGAVKLSDLKLPMFTLPKPK